MAGVVVNNAFYDGGNDGGPEKRQSMKEVRKEAAANGWKLGNFWTHAIGVPQATSR